jgi:hypothetical protein
MWFPKHKASMTIQHNDHKTYYIHIDDYIKQDEIQFQTEQDKLDCIKNDELWGITWYPDTPIGFYDIYAPTFEKLMEYAQKIEHDIEYNDKFKKLLNEETK